jgi:tetratricopeptide (TPR) repeat protein
MGLISQLISQGDWDGALTLTEGLRLEPQTAVASQVTGCLELARVAHIRGEPELAEQWLARISPDVESTNDIQLRHVVPWKTAIVAMGENRPADVIPPLLEMSERLAADRQLSWAEYCFTDAATAASDLGEPELASPFVALAEATPARERTRTLEIACARIRGNVAAAVGDEDAAADQYAKGLAIARNLGRDAELAPLLFDYGRWLVETGRADEAGPLLDEARALFEGMRAKRWLDRLDRVTPQAEAAVS